MAMASIPHLAACFMISSGDETASRSLKLVWQCSSTRLTGASSVLLSRPNGSHFLIPRTEPRVSSPSKRSMVVAARSLRNVPSLRNPETVSASSGPMNIFTVMESVKSVISKENIVRSFFLSLRATTSLIRPCTLTSPMTSCISESAVNSSMKLLP